MVNNFLYSQYLYSKDSVNLGRKSNFMTSCIKSSKNQMIELQGVKFNSSSYCSCISEKIIPTITSSQLQTAMKNNKIQELFFGKGHLELLIECMKGEIVFDSDYKVESNSPFVKEKAIIGCTDSFLKERDNQSQWTTSSAKRFCTCAIEKLYSAGYSYKEISEIKDENSNAFNEIIVPCFTQENRNNSYSIYSNTYSAQDIIGSGTFSDVSLMNYLNTAYKLKLNISEVEKYFTFDTGASDLIINPTIENQLIANGSLKKENYLGYQEYTLANGDTVLAQMVRIDNIKIGDYTVNNVIVAIVQEGSLLCGKGFLDKFKKWTLDEDLLTLRLFK